MQHNSVGACTGGELVCDGYINWRPYSISVTIWSEGQKIAYAVIGTIRTSTAEDGTRTSRLPLVNHASLEKEGLARLGSRFGEIQTLGCTLPDITFAMTIGGRLDQAIEASPTSSWGVLADGRFVVGSPNLLGAPVQLSGSDPRVALEGSGYEVSNAVTEIEVRAASRWQSAVYQRTIGALQPRKGIGVTSDEILREKELDLIEQGTTPDVTWPLKFYVEDEIGSGKEKSYLFGLVDMAELVRESYSNPEKKDAVQRTRFLHIEIDVELEGVSATPPADFFSIDSTFSSPGHGLLGGRDVYLKLHLEYDFYLKYPQWRIRAPADEEAEHRRLYSEATDLTNPSVVSRGVALYERARMEAWKRRLAYEYVVVTFAEWLTKTGTPAPPPDPTAPPPATPPPTLLTDPSLAKDHFLERYSLGPATTPPSGDGGAFVPEDDLFGRALRMTAGFTGLLQEYAYRAWCAGNTHYPMNLTNKVDTNKDAAGLVTLLSNHEVSLKQGRPLLKWRFSIPESLLREPSEILPENYNYAFALAIQSNTTTSKARVARAKAVWGYEDASGSIDYEKHAPTYTMPILSPETYQGEAHGMLFHGPAQINGQWITHSEMVIDLDSFYTKFQTSSVQRKGR